MRATSLLLLAGLIAAPGFAQDGPKSGLSVGSEMRAFDVYPLTGRFAGKEMCYT